MIINCRSSLAMGLKCRGIGVFISLVLTLLFWNEFLVYHFVLLHCYWPVLNPLKADVSRTDVPINSEPLKAMFVADTHVLGSQAHWLDKLRR